MVVEQHKRLDRVPTLFPSLAHLDLLRAGVIQEPAVGLNEGRYRWILDEPTWTYTADLVPILSQVRAREHQSLRYWLHFEGLDTIADVYIGGQLVQQTQNAHLWHVIPVPAHLLESETTNITLVFHNTNAYAAEQASQFSPGYPNQVDSPDRSRTSDYEYPNRIFVRKQQSDFGWDWGPALVPVGPHKPAYLIALPHDTTSTLAQGEKAAAAPVALVIASSIDIYRKGQTNNLAPPHPDANWIVNVTLLLLSSHDVHWPSLRLSLPELGLYTFDTLLSSPIVRAGLNEPVHAVFEVPSSGHYAPSLWWPRGHGEQPLYEIVLRSDELHLEMCKKVGFRTAFFDLSPISPELVAEGVQPGSHFRLLVNSKEIYVMGTNLIPFDTLSPRTNPAYLRWLLDSAMQANTNLVRIWGGGSYPSPDFLSLCDELGLMVWVDTMFAASLYPYHDSFLDAVRDEVAQVLPALITHPSVVVVVGNNEGELYFLGGYGRRDEDAEWKRGYERLFDHVVRDQVLQASRGMSYVPCSTTTGYLSLEPYRGRYDHYPKTELHGTGEHYGYNASAAFDMSTYPRSRFMVEFGMFSLPSIGTLDRVLSLSDYSIDSMVLRAHLKHPPAGNLTYPFGADQGQHELVSAVETWFPSPASLARTSLPPRAVLARWSYTSQLYQALYVSAQVGVYRMGAGRRERNRGLVVWQLNDVWPGTSWSSLEYGGTWKMLQYALAAVQAPVAVTGVYDAAREVLDVVVLFSRASGEAVTVGMEWLDLLGGRLAEQQTVEVYLPFNGEIGSLDIHTFAQPTTTICTGKEGCYLRLTLTLISSATGERITTSTYWTPMPALKRTLAHVAATHRRPHLVLSRISADPSPAPSRGGYARWTVRVSNTGEAVAPYVFVEPAAHHVGFFARCHHTAGSECGAENTFWLAPNSSRILTFVRPRLTAVQRSVSAQNDEEEEEEWFTSLSVSSLFDNLPPHPAAG